MFEQLVPDEQRRAERSTGITGGGLNPDVVERPLAHEASVGHTIQGHAAGHHEPLLAGLGADVAAHAQDRVLGHGLDAGREVHVVLLDP